MSDDSFHNFHLDQSPEPLPKVGMAGMSLPSLAAACLDGFLSAGSASTLLLLLLSFSTTFGLWLRSWFLLTWPAAFLGFDFIVRFLAIRFTGRSAGEFVAASETAWNGVAPARAALLGMASLLPLRLVGLVEEPPRSAD